MTLKIFLLFTNIFWQFGKNSIPNIPLMQMNLNKKIIWNNRFIRINGKTINYKTWVNKGILRISDLIDTDDHFLSFENFKCKFSIR